MTRETRKPTRSTSTTPSTRRPTGSPPPSARSPAAGPAFAFIAQVAFFVAGPDLKRRENELLGTDDDHVGSVDVVLSTKDLVQLTRTLSPSFEGIFAQFESPLISGDGASYKAYFEVQAVPF